MPENLRVSSSFGSWVKSGERIDCMMQSKNFTFACQ